MNEIVNKCLLRGDKFMPEMHIKQPKFTQPQFTHLCTQYQNQKRWNTSALHKDKRS